MKIKRGSRRDGCGWEGDRSGTYLSAVVLFVSGHFVMVQQKLSWCESAVLRRGNKNIEKDVVMYQHQMGTL